MDIFYPWKDIVGKKVSKLRSIAELRAFYGTRSVAGKGSEMLGERQARGEGGRQGERETRSGSGVERKVEPGRQGEQETRNVAENRSEK
jgi:hypothetical protein